MPFLNFKTFALVSNGPGLVSSLVHQTKPLIIKSKPTHLKIIKPFKLNHLKSRRNQTIYEKFSTKPIHFINQSQIKSYLTKCNQRRWNIIIFCRVFHNAMNKGLSLVTIAITWYFVVHSIQATLLHTKSEKYTTTRSKWNLSFALMTNKIIILIIILCESGLSDARYWSLWSITKINTRYYQQKNSIWLCF
mgnify:CR=1 FL=1